MKKILSFFVLGVIMISMPVTADSGRKSTGDYSYLPDPVAEIGSKKISRKQALTYLTSRLSQEQLKAMDPEEIKLVLSELMEREINRSIMNAILKKSNVTPSPILVKRQMIKLIKSLPAHRRKALVQNLKSKKLTLKQYIENASKDTDEQLRAAINLWVRKTNPQAIKGKKGEAEDYYRLRQELFLIPDHVTISQIVVDKSDSTNAAKAADKIKTAYSRLIQGEPFAKTAKEFSDNPSGKSKGLISGTFTRNELPKKIADIAFLQKSGQFSKIIILQKSYVIVKTENVTHARYVPFEEVKRFIKMELQSAKTKVFVGKILRQKRRTLKIKLYFK
ncbi:peptidyl-prolyl cis-trans isomerase [Lentisphaerota bacterium ZTH]|nr:peptidyl-prolyl cis-trans isomerase [Lentisphaerota bacterium]WET06898.1 peptidyl-prolyl cis-trans isomerase [Lentisphaerota bacterium ZTH]